MASIPISAANELCREICEALGLKYVRKLDIHIELGEIVSCVAEFFPVEDGVKQLIPILQKFSLCVDGEPVKDIYEKVPIGSKIDTSTLGEMWKKQEIVNDKNHG